MGFVGGSMFRSFKEKGASVFGYDKYKKDIDMGPLDLCLSTKITFLCLPTLFNKKTKSYDKSAINNVCSFLNEKKYQGVVVLKSTVEPQTVNKLCDKYTNLQFIHNPEFLTARTAFHDFHNQTHIVLGKSKSCSQKNYDNVYRFYNQHYPRAQCSCSSDESECEDFCK